MDETGATPGWSSSHGVVSLKAVSLVEREIMNVWHIASPVARAVNAVFQSGADCSYSAIFVVNIAILELFSLLVSH